MAIAIRSIPTLYGDDADRFLHSAENAERNTHKQDISRNIQLVTEFLHRQNL